MSASPEIVERIKGFAEKLGEAFKGEAKGVEVLDVGDIEVIKFDSSLIISFPPGKELYLIPRLGPITLGIKKLREVV